MHVGKERAKSPLLSLPTWRNMPTAYSKVFRINTEVPEGMDNEDFDQEMERLQTEFAEAAEAGRLRTEQVLKRSARQFNATVTLEDN